MIGEVLRDDGRGDAAVIKGRRDGLRRERLFLELVLLFVELGDEILDRGAEDGDGLRGADGVLVRIYEARRRRRLAPGGLGAELADFRVAFTLRLGDELLGLCAGLADGEPIRGLEL